MTLLPGHDRRLVRGLRGYVLELLLQMLLVRHEVFSRLGNSIRTDTEAMEMEEKEEEHDLEEKEEETKRGSKAVTKPSYVSFCLRTLSAEIVGCLTEFTSRSAKLHKAPLSVAFQLQAALELEEGNSYLNWDAALASSNPDWEQSERNDGTGWVDEWEHV